MSKKLRREYDRDEDRPSVIMDRDIERHTQHELEVTCVERERTRSGHSRIVRLGIKMDDRVQVLSEEEVVERIQAEHRFYVLRDGHKAYLRISLGANGEPRVETDPDDTRADNLRSLPACASVRRTPLFAGWPLLAGILVLFAILLWLTTFRPTITWPKPADITYPTPLGSAQLDAQAWLAGIPAIGTYKYTPGSSQVLPVGNDEPLSVNFVLSPMQLVGIAELVVLVLIIILTILLGRLIRWRGTFANGLRWGALLIVVLVAGVLVFDTVFYRNASASETINVLAPPTPTPTCTPIITWANPAAITYPAPLGDVQLNAQGSVPGALAYDPGKGTVLNVGDGQPLTVTLKPDDSTCPIVTKTVEINVLPPTPVCTPTQGLVTWNIPGDIPAGTPLGDAQLNAKALLPGAFIYNPPAGTIPPAGINQLSVTFWPSDIGYCRAIKSVPLNVVPTGAASIRIDFDQGVDIKTGSRTGRYEIREVLTGRLLGVWDAPNGSTDSGCFKTLPLSFPSVWVAVTFYPAGGGASIPMKILNPAGGTEYGWISNGGCAAIEVEYPR